MPAWRAGRNLAALSLIQYYTKTAFGGESPDAAVTLPARL
jgi:hypothetical protein